MSEVDSRNGRCFVVFEGVKAVSQKMQCDVMDLLNTERSFRTSHRIVNGAQNPPFPHGTVMGFASECWDRSYLESPFNSAASGGMIISI